MEQVLDAPDTSETQLNYAGFWIRFAAAVIDYIVFIVINIILSFVGLAVSSSGSTFIGISFFIIAVLYFVIMESSVKQGTLGKMAVGIQVGDEYGNRLSFANALGRYFAKFLSALILAIGFLMVAWDPKKQGLHDKLASTIVFYRR